MERRHAYSWKRHTADGYRYKSFYVRLDSFRLTEDGYVYCVETADEDEARKNLFDDAWCYEESDGIDATLTQRKRDLENKE